MKTNIKRGLLFGLIAAAILCLLCALLIGCGKKESEEDQGEKTVKSISLDTRNAKTEFFVGDSFTTLGLGVRLIYTDDTDALVLPEGDKVEVLAPTLNSIGRKKVTVKYESFMAEYTVNVVKLDHIEVNPAGARLGYAVGENVTTDGIVVTAHITQLNELNEEVTRADVLRTRDYTVKAPELTAPGIRTVEIAYAANTQLTAEYEVYVTPDVNADSVLTFEGEGTLSLYITGRTGGNSALTDCTAEGWFLLVLPNGSFKMYETTMNYTASSGSDTSDGTVQTSVLGESLIATVDGKTYTINLYIYHTMVFGWEKQIVGIQVELPSTSKEYLAGATFTSDGLTATKLIYSDGTVEENPAGSFTSLQTPSQADMNEVGVKTVTGIYTLEDDTEVPFSYQIYCIPDVFWDTNKLDFGGDHNGSGSTLELFVTERSNANGSWNNPEQFTKGWLLVRNTDGSYEMYEYEYYLDTGVKSHPYPNGNPEGVSPDGVSSRVPPSGEQYGDLLVVEIGGRTFVAADGNRWHFVVLGWQ